MSRSILAYKSLDVWKMTCFWCNGIYKLQTLSAVLIATINNINKLLAVMSLTFTSAILELTIDFVQ